MPSSRSRYSNSRNVKKVNKQRKLINMLICILVVFLLVFAFNVIKKDKNQTMPTDAMLEEGTASEDGSSEDKGGPDNYKQLPKEDVKIKITAIGDVMCHNTQYEDAYVSATGAYDFDYVFESVKKHTRVADLTIANLETTFAGKERIYSGYPTFNSPETLGNALQNIGVDVFTTANNHSLDKGYNGLESTLNKLDDMGMSHTGTARSQEERDTVLIKTVKGAKFAFLSYSYGTNGMPIPSGKEFCINLIDKNLIKKDLDRAKAEDVDMIIVSIHWGVEYQTTPNTEQKNLEKFLFENGADIILGSHPHVLQPMEEKTITTVEGETKKVFVVYSLGNFISGQTAKNTNLSIILNIDLIRKAEDGKVTISNINYRPIYMLNKGKVAHRYAILDIYDCMADYENKVAGAVNKATYDKLAQALKDIHKIIGDKYDQEKVIEGDALILE